MNANTFGTTNTKRQAIENAIKEAEKGVFVSAKAMSEWIDSWGKNEELSPPRTEA